MWRGKETIGQTVPHQKPCYGAVKCKVLQPLDRAYQVAYKDSSSTDKEYFRIEPAVIIDKGHDWAIHGLGKISDLKA